MTKGILVVSFGTSYPETRRKTIEACERAIQERFPEYVVYRAFTSNMVIKSVAKKEGIHIPTVAQALEQMKQDGIKEVYIQPLHVILGGEYQKIVTQAQEYQQVFEHLSIGTPLLHTFEDYQAVKEFLVDIYAKNDDTCATILMGHGSEHYAFTAYAALDHMLDGTNIHIAAVESYPSVESIEEKLAKKGIKRVHLAPFMLVAGDHATNDMASDDEDSWYTYLTQKGYTVTTQLVGLGEYTAIQKMYINHLMNIIM
ncbi:MULTISPECIES: sirohydrochlorin cobaltochelatase [unclassified Granulicatella]|uniref:sirohydrochlorin cobaltochelatase n=1 Tax=unclassified Granulicatella TaxID=2630493 RepID=UPI001074834B|nr:MULTISPECIES: sirohydrochlorin cobaltochelatase [unclassified Granulicatella]MBF0779521.1 sirohydrochlorin cobaltochelatase [Granulicatella sp. 19428wC4_WM01]TFU96486.1 sirohydrochlorin cobaltochelatase [Granulicatella sp. WM01]